MPEKFCTIDVELQGFAIPSSSVLRIVPQLIQFGKMDFTLPGTGETLTPDTSRIDHLPPCIDMSSTENSKGRSDVWGHFTKQKPYSEKKAKCNYCGDLIKYLTGTSGMRNHLTRCKENPNREAFKRQKLSMSTTEDSVGPSPTISKFDQNASRMKLVKMFMKSELPFRFVENEDFRDFEVFGIGRRIRQYSESSDVSIKLMAMRMKGKSKLDFVNYFIDYLFESSMASELKSKLLSSLKTLYEQYQEITSQDEMGPSNAINLGD
ncbi:hypothetical protein V8G54_023037 [Vigna mungo]|uniref:BED-type domain-containing protein n=1 Tax=Vigna mungo TaxID=3915 RepID=A0AAQ3N3Z9_VIGMU